MFYIILLLLFVIGVGIMTLAENERRTFPVLVARIFDSAMSGLGYGIVTFYLAKYFSSLI
jgi:hypothetical protein|nr:MAG TPA: hypothetical protein [Caudoviricetes sp.]